MDSVLSMGLGPSIFHIKTPSLPTTIKPSINPPLSFPSHLHFTTPRNPSSNPPRGSHIRVRASSNPTPRNGGSSPNPIIRTLKTAAAAAAVVFAAVGKFQQFPARAETAPTIVTEEKIDQNQQQQENEEEEKPKEPSTPLSQLLESNSEAVEALKSLLQQKLEAGEDEKALKILEKLVSDLPEETEWKFLMARLLNELGRTQDARQVFEEILKRNPLSFEALFENALLMDRCGEGNAVILRLEEALMIAKEENKVKEARDVRLIMAQIQFLQKNVEAALRSYEELGSEDPKDFRPYFCKGMIYSLLDRNKEAREEFAKYRELSPKKFEVEGYLRSPLSRMKVFGTNEEN